MHRWPHWLIVAAALLAATAHQADARGFRGPICETCAPACPPTMTVLLEACHPCTGCKLQIPVCIPACCEGVPCVRSRPALIGVGVTRFEWCCGTVVVVRFFRCGDYTVRVL